MVIEKWSNDMNFNKKYLGILLAITLVMGFAQYTPNAYALGGIEFLEFDNADGDTPDIIQIKDDMFAVVYEGSNDDGKIVTFTVSATGVVSNAVLNGGVIATFDDGTIVDPKIIHVTGEIYAVIYEDGTGIRVETIRITNAGDITVDLTDGAIDLITGGSNPDVVLVSGNIYAIAATASDAGVVRTISITTAGAISSPTVPANFVTFDTNADEIDIIKVNSTTGFAVAYQGELTGTATTGLTIETLHITENGVTITQTDFGRQVVAAGTTVLNPMILHITGDEYITSYTDGTALKMDTQTIPVTGELVANSGGTFNLDAAGGSNSFMIPTDINVSPKAFAVVYQGVSTDGFIELFTIGDNGDALIRGTNFEFDPINGGTPTIVHRAGDIYAVAYLGDGANGFVQSISINEAVTTQLDPTTGNPDVVATVSSRGGGSGSGDQTKPSITVGFDQNEFPLKYDGVNYQSYQLDSMHTALIETGEELKMTLTIYENSGPGNVQHVEVYLNQFGSQILNDLTETIVIYDDQSGLEIIDPYRLIASADIIPSVSGNKAVFDIVLVFEDEIPKSDLVIRLWDIRRNSIDIHLPDALIVSQSSTEPTIDVITEPSITIETSTVIESGSVIEAGTVIESGTIIESGVTIESGVIIESGTIIESGVTIEPGVTTEEGISLQAGTTSETGITSATTTTIETSTVIESGSVIEAGTVIESGTIIESGVTIEPGVIIESGTIIESGVIIMSGVTTEEGILLGAGTTSETGIIAIPETIPEPGVSEPEPELEPVVPKAVPEISETVPEVELPPKTWTSGQLSVLKKWAGYDTESASDLDVLSKFGIKGEKIPQYVQQFVKWILKDQISQEEFVNALQYLKKEGILSKSVGKQSLDVNNQLELEEFTLERESITPKLKFEFGENENFYTQANLDDLEDKIRTLRALANNMEIQNELARSNIEFDSIAAPNYLIDQRELDWIQNPKIVTPFMESLMNNESALIAKALIEHHNEDLVPLISIVITNAYGVNTVITEKTHDYKQSDEQWWEKTKASGTFISSGSGSEDHAGQLYTAEISITINDGEGNFIGIMKAVVNFEKALLSE